MRESYREGVASRSDPESCGIDREGDPEALTGESAGRVLSREITRSGVPTQSVYAEGHTVGRATASDRRTPRGLRPRACVEAPCAGSGRSHGSPRGEMAHGDARGRPRP